MSLAQVLQVPFAPSRYAQTGGVLLQDLNSASAQSVLGVVADDQFQIQLFPRSITGIIGAATATLQLTSPSVIIFSIKALDAIGGTVLLGEATGFTEYVDGLGNWYYGSTLNLDEEAIATALGEADDLACIAEIRITDSTGSTKRYQFALTLFEAVYTGAEDTIIPPVPGASLLMSAGTQAVGAGVDFVTVTGLGMSAPPALYIPQLVKSDGSKDNIDCVLRAGWTGDGFTVDLTAATADATYVLTWLVMAAGGSIGTIAVPTGADSLEVPLTLASAPKLIIPVLVKPLGDLNIRAILRSGWGPSGFTVDFTGLIPDSSFVLYYLIIP